MGPRVKTGKRLNVLYSNPFLVLSVICEGVGMQTAHEQGLYLMEPTRCKRDIVTRFFILRGTTVIEIKIL